MDFLAKLDAETLKAELLSFLDNKADGDLIDEFVDYIREDFSYGDCDED